MRPEWQERGGVGGRVREREDCEADTLQQLQATRGEDDNIINNFTNEG